MLTCIARAKQSSNEASSVDIPPPEKFNSNATPTKQAMKSLSSQIKDMALKASGAYRQCAPCAAQTTPQQRRNGGGESDSDRFRWSYRRAGSSGSNSSSAAGRKQLEARLKGISSGEGTPGSGRRVDPVVFVEESEPKEWVAQVEPGVLITFVSLPRGGNDLKQIKFSREMFNKWQAQKWWTDNCEKVTELYNVQRLNRQAFPPPPGDEYLNTKMESVEDSPVTPSIGRECPTGAGVASSSSDSLEQRSISNGTAAKTEEASSSVDASAETTSSSPRNADGSISNAASTVEETEWVEEDEPGVYITIRALPHGRRELRRVRFSREKFGEMHARMWWEENRGRIHEQYL